LGASRTLLAALLLTAVVASIALPMIHAHAKTVLRTYTFSSYLNKLQVSNPVAPNFFWDATPLIYDYLALYDYLHNRPIPHIAYKWKWINSTALEIWIRRGVKWSDGTPFTAWDAWAQFVIIHYWGWFEYRDIKWVKVVNNYTLIINFKRRNIFEEFFILNAFPMWMPCKYWCPFAKEIIKAVKEGNRTLLSKVLNEIYNYKPPKVLALGPYKPAVATATVYVLVKNPLYWNKTVLKYAPDEIQILSARSNDILWMWMKGGSIDYANIVMPPSVEEAFKGLSWVRIIKIPQCGFAIYFNLQNKWLRLYKVREAIALLLNRTDIAYAAYRNIYTPVKIPDCLYSWMRKEWLNKTVISMELPYKYNPKKAAEILESLGFKKINGKWYTPDGKLWVLRIRAPSGWTDWASAMEAVAMALRKFGITVDYREVETGSYFSIVWHQKQFDLAINWWGCWHIRHPYWSFWQWVNRFENLGFPTTFYVPGVGKINASKVLNELLYARSLSEQKKLVALLALVTDRALPIYVIAVKNIPQWVSLKHFVWPPPNSWVWWITWHTKFLATAIDLGLIRPRSLAPTQTPITHAIHMHRVTHTSATATHTISTKTVTKSLVRATTTTITKVLVSTTTVVKKVSNGLPLSEAIGIGIAIIVAGIVIGVAIRRRTH